MVITNPKLNKVEATDYMDKYQELTMEALTVSFNASLQTLFAVTEGEEPANNEAKTEPTNTAASTNTTSQTDTFKPASTKKTKTRKKKTGNIDNGTPEKEQSALSKVIKVIKIFIDKILNSFVEKTSSLINGVLVKRYQNEHDALNQLPPNFYKTIESIDFVGYFGTNLDITKFDKSIYTALGVKQFKLSTTSIAFKNGWADEQAFNDWIAPSLKNVPNAQGNGDETLAARAKRFYNNAGNSVKYTDPPSFISKLMEYCDKYQEGTVKEIEKELNAIKTDISSIHTTEESVNMAFSDIDDICILMEGINVAGGESTETKEDGDSKPADGTDNADGDEEVTPKVMDSTKAKNMKKYLNGLISIETARMTMAEQCFIAALRQLHEVYAKGVRDGFIKKEENEVADATDTVNKINPA